MSRDEAGKVGHGRRGIVAVAAVAVVLLYRSVAGATGWGPRDFVVADFNAWRIGVYDENLVFRGYLDEAFPGATALDFAPDGTLIAVGQPGPSRLVRRYRPDGTVTSSVDGEPELGFPQDVSVGRCDHLFIGTGGALEDLGVVEAAVDGTPLRHLGSGQYAGVAALPGDVLWAARFSSRGGVIEVFDAGTGLQTASISPDGGQVYASSLFFDARNHSVLMADPASDMVFERTTAGTLQTVFSVPSSPPPVGFLGFATRGPGDDVLATNYRSCHPVGPDQCEQEHPSEIYRWKADGTFVDTTALVEVHGALGIVWAGNAGTGQSSDTDADGLCNADDNCPTVPNAGQENLDGDDAGDVCDPADARLRLRGVHVRASRNVQQPLGFMRARGDFPTQPPSDVFSAAQGLVLRIEDAGGLRQTFSWTADECAVDGHGRTRCRGNERRWRLSVRPVRSSPAGQRFRFSAHKLNLVPPFVPPVTVTITHGAGIDRVGTIDLCKDRTSGLHCRQ